MKIYNDNLIKKWEELRLEAYLPTPNDVWTIGWGHTRTAYKGMTVTKEQAAVLFDEDVRWVENALAKHVKVELTQNQYDALASLVFNIGETNFRNSTLLRKLNAGDYEGAANEFHRWKYQNGVVLRGLVRRRAEEAEYFLNPSDVGITPQAVDAPSEFHSLGLSKEVIAGVGAVLTGGGAFMGSLGEKAQENLSMALSAALIMFGVFFVVNRLIARWKAER